MAAAEEGGVDAFMKDKSEAELVEYLTNHLAYERKMLGFTFKMLSEADGLRWSAFFESFGLHARNLYDFLRHEGKRGNTIRADDYLSGRKRPTPSRVDGRLNASFFHLSTERLKNDPVNLKDAIQIAEWIDAEWKRWAEQLSAPFNRLVDPAPVCAVQAETTLYTPTASSEVRTF